MHIFLGFKKGKSLDNKVLLRKYVHNYVDNVYYFLYNFGFIFTLIVSVSGENMQ